MCSPKRTRLLSSVSHGRQGSPQALVQAQDFAMVLQSDISLAAVVVAAAIVAVVVADAVAAAASAVAIAYLEETAFLAAESAASGKSAAEIVDSASPFQVGTYSVAASPSVVDHKMGAAVVAA